ncbi:MAG: ArsO family NAD(P)H-dependent flavin-containing monooxygenase [Bacteroidota bacterium]
MEQYDVIVIGGGQSGLAMGYFLRRTGFKYILLDEQNTAGGAWIHGWDSLKLFSPAEHNALPGWPMPKQPGHEYPTKDHVINYLEEYEKKYKLSVQRPVKVEQVNYVNQQFQLSTSVGQLQTKTLVSATGSWANPYTPEYEGLSSFEGLQVHSAFYESPEKFADQHVLVIGGGNSGAQILAEVSKVANTTWITLTEPKLLPDEVDGRYLFEFATKQYKARMEGKDIKPAGGLGDVVMVDSVKEARSRNVLHSKRPFRSFYDKGVIWPDGSQTPIDAVIWCTGFKASLNHLDGLNLRNENGKIDTKGTQAINQPGLWLVGYGSWTGYASATLIGVGRTARQTVKEIQAYLQQ